MIQINDLQGLTLEKIANLIEDDKRDFLEIFVPKNTKRYFSEDSAIASDYACAAYSGQKLLTISNSFSYKKVPPENHESILFEISVSDKQKLAEVLWHLSCLYGFNEDLEREEGWEDDYVGQFLYEIESGITEAACPYFVDVHNQFAGEDYSEDDSRA